jgi:hypothetical protein
MSKEWSNGPDGICRSLPSIVNDSGPPMAPKQFGKMKPMPARTRTSRLSTLGSGVGIALSPSPPPTGGPARRLPEQAPVSGPCGVGKLRYLSASIVVALVEGMDVAPSCLSTNVTDGKWVVHLNRAVSRS